MGRVIIRRGPFADGGPALLHPWGPPRDEAEPIDLELFSIYFLVTETVATYLWFSIAAHCLEGTRLPAFFSPWTRYIIGFAYAGVKLSLLQYAFQSSIYYHVTLVCTIVYLVLAAVAGVWRRGPMWPLFYGRPLRVFEPYSLATFVQHIGYVVLQGLVSVPQPRDEQPPPPSIQLQLSKLRMHVDVNVWNGTMVEHWRLALLSYGLQRRTTRDNLPYYETRLLFAMQDDGLLISFYLLPPVPSILLDLHAAGHNVYELVLRYLKCSSSTAVSSPLMYYADNPIASAKTSPAQRVAINDLLRRLNVNTHIGSDIPLRLLKCQNFIAAGTPTATKRRSRAMSTSKFHLD
ncbi:hypothetical protein ACHHYP_01076 [Achlya hypogyna]|uniref:Transmembrane protein n=1 Tax=Achlya hypogyna TaxID=1202772 RepID=A0A1V9ZTS5_ACHHY|nr:hypothetical protein ACHHYP_01076 [Achlya hypogyna]